MIMIIEKTTNDNDISNNHNKKNKNHNIKPPPGTFQVIVQDCLSICQSLHGRTSVWFRPVSYGIDNSCNLRAMLSWTRASGPLGVVEAQCRQEFQELKQIASV